MNREELMTYLTEAVDALDENEIDQVFPDNGQPDLYTVVQELVGLRGEVRKLAQSTLKTNHAVQTVIDQQKELAEQARGNLRPQFQPVAEKNDGGDDAHKELLRQVLEYDDIVQRTAAHFKTLPEAGFFNLNAHRQQMSSWKKGYEISVLNWKKMVSSIGLYPTGRAGEPFDPACHEAVAVKSDALKEAGTILESVVLGYLHGQKLVRRAKVVVNKLD